MGNLQAKSWAFQSASSCISSGVLVCLIVTGFMAATKKPDPYGIAAIILSIIIVALSSMLLNCRIQIEGNAFQSTRKENC
ncbi:MAG: hypothetical protein Edafosvirus10_30 [Edafosvirus sp.]|uniref:Uncharacterized protein n=1 Tax=Edafosvirus sp. TaxID=2487765 RepID=A0A3G4ZTX8_9VIRU|nr:MAG: hypothetical protein Edafosvirus10_30 [Edafosvirus sp.]